MSIVIPAGATSSVICTFLMHLSKQGANFSNVWAVVRPESKHGSAIQNLERLGVNLVTEADVLELPARIGANTAIWASSHSDPVFMTQLQEKYKHILLIGTAAMVAKIRDQNLGQFYGDAKWAMWEQNKNKTTMIMPGWFIPDTGVIDGSSLNEANVKKLFNDRLAQAQDQTFWNKAPFSVTPVSKLVQFIEDWLSNPTRFTTQVPLLACTVRTHPWIQLRAYAEGISQCGEENPDIYGDLPKAFEVSTAEVMEACQKVRHLLN